MREDRIPTMPQAEERIPTMPQVDERIPTMPQTEERIPTMPQAEERIPTMPQVEERIPTMPQNDGRMPTVPQDDGRIPTIPQGDGRIATVPQDGRTATVPQGGYSAGGSVNEAIIRTDSSFIGVRGRRFTIYATQIISADSGESQIYGCVEDGAAEKYVARVLKSITPSSPIDKLVQRDKVINFLLQHSNKENSHILPLVDHGTVQQGGMEYFVEVYPFCNGGDLGQRKGAIPYEVLCKEIVPAINEALRTFHSAGFVHRDVKPDNLYYYNGQVVLGDFGITCDLVNNNFATDRTKTGTLGYYAPELMSQAAVKASDYYSFGQTLWTLYSGEMMYQNILRRFRSEGIEVQRNQVNFAMMQDTYYGLEEIKEEERFFEILIRGLLQYDVNSRFNYDQVKRWLDNDYSLTHEISNYQDIDTYPIPFRVEGVQCWNHAQLIDALRNNWEEALAILYSDELSSFFRHINPRLSNEIDQITRKYSRHSKNNQISMMVTHDIGLSQLLLLLSKGKCLVWGDIAYNQLSDLGYNAIPVENVTHRYHADEAGFYQSGLVLDWYKMCSSMRKEKTDEYVVKALAATQDYAINTAWDSRNLAIPVARAIVQHVFKAMEGKSQFENYASIEELVDSLTNKETGIYGYIEKGLLQNPEFYGFLYAQGYNEFADALLKEQRTEFDQVEILFYFFEQQIQQEALKSKLVEFYKMHGPEAYLLWFKNNLSLYDFNGEDAAAIRTQIDGVEICGASIAEVKSCYASLLELVTKFRTLFVDNVYMAKLGLTSGKEKNGITSRHLFAYWHKKLLGRDVPIGFDIS